MKFIKREYHIVMAGVLNLFASLGSWLMRKAGKASNYHEKRVEELS